MKFREAGINLALGITLLTTAVVPAFTLATAEPVMAQQAKKSKTLEPIYVTKVQMEASRLRVINLQAALSDCTSVGVGRSCEQQQVDYNQHLARHNRSIIGTKPNKRRTGY